MPVFKCVKSARNPDLLGETIVAKRDIEAGYLTVLKDSDAKYPNGIHMWSKGQALPVNGSLWGWKEVK